MTLRVTAAGILSADNLTFVEPTFADLIDRRFNAYLVASEGDQGRLLIDEEEEPLALAIGDGTDWTAGSFHLRKPDVAVIDRFDETNGEIYQEERETWAAAVRDFFSGRLMETYEPAVEDMNAARPGMVEGLLGSAWSGMPRGVCLECGCGSGVGSLVLRRLGFSPLSFDNDPSLLSLGLSAGRLLPEETMCIDASIADRYMGRAPFGLGLMFGEINPFNREIWEKITRVLVSLTDRTVITTGTENEARMVSEWVGDGAEVFENPRDLLYDRWVCSRGT